MRRVFDFPPSDLMRPRYCRSVDSRMRMQNAPLFLVSKVRKDFSRLMVFKQHDFTVADFTFIGSKKSLPLQGRTRPLCHCFVNSGFPRKTKFAQKQKSIYGKKRTANILENCTCQQVNKAKDNTDKQRSPRQYPLLTVFSRSDQKKKKTFSFTVS